MKKNRRFNNPDMLKRNLDILAYIRRETERKGRIGKVKYIGLGAAAGEHSMKAARDGQEN